MSAQLAVRVTQADLRSFSGSAGTALIPSSKLDAKALLFVDSRYWVLAEKEVPKKGWEVKRVGASGGSGRSAVVGGWVDYVAEVRVCFDVR